GERAGEPAAGDVVDRAQPPAARRLADGRERARLLGEVDLGQRVRQAAAQLLQLRAGERGPEGPDEGDHVAVGAEGAAGDLRRIGELAYDADDRRRVDRAGRALVVERDVAADDGDAERAAGVGEAADGAI